MFTILIGNDSTPHYLYYMQQEDSFFKGRGAQLNTKNPYLSNEYVAEHIEGLDEELVVKITFLRRWL
ncbi:MAG: hypothetical protein JKY53_07950 [Flavobacteriales bacterium]|nr:hypothetical protein [Flavobacteriales bacterium]